MAHLADKTYTVALTIRKGASPIVRGVCGSGTVAANVKDAALEAMKAPGMAEISSPEALADLAIDLEGLGALVRDAGFRVLEQRLLPPRGPAALVLAEATP